MSEDKHGPHRHRRPTFFPSSMLKPHLDTLTFTPQKAILQALHKEVADLSRPKAALQMLHDHVRLEAWETGIIDALKCRPGAQFCGQPLVLGRCTGGLRVLRFHPPLRRLSCPGAWTRDRHSWADGCKRWRG